MGLASLVVSTGCGGGSGPGTTGLIRPTDGATLRPSMARGANVTAYSADALTAPLAAQALRDLRATGADRVVFPVLWFQATRRSSALAPDPLQTPSDASLVAAARTAKALGMAVGVAPHINVRDGTFRGEIAPAQRDAWYVSYGEMLTHYADVARDAGADLLVVGSELSSMSGDADRWRALIVAARSRFTGRLTYAANWVQEAEHVRFWDALDQVGIDVYMPLTPGEPRPSTVRLEQAWKPWVARMKRLHDRVGKPILISEIGYTSRAGTAEAPAQEGDGPIDPAVQADAYEAALRSLGRLPWIDGLLIWDWSADGHQSAGGYSPQGKPAQAVLTRWYGGG